MNRQCWLALVAAGGVADYIDTGSWADKAVKEQMLCWLYDEDRWPSGFAGGLVTKDKQYRCVTGFTISKS